MPAAELRNWAKYLDARPIGWRADNAAAMQLSAAGVKASGHELFSSLAQMKVWEDGRDEEEKERIAMQSSLSKSVFGALLQQAHK